MGEEDGWRNRGNSVDVEEKVDKDFVLMRTGGIDGASAELDKQAWHSRRNNVTPITPRIFIIYTTMPFTTSTFKSSRVLFNGGQDCGSDCRQR